jgi:hypothetical protein
MAITQGPFRGTFTSTGVAQRIAVRSGVDYIKFTNRTQWFDDDPSGPIVVGGEYYANMAAGSAIILRKLSGDNTLEGVGFTADGFTLIDDGNPQSFAAVATANPAFNQADGATFTTSSGHGLSIGDVVRVYGLTGAKQYSGLLLSVVTVPDSTSFTTRLNTTAITQATAGFVRKIASRGLFFPQNRQILQVTKGTTTVIRLNVQHTYTIGDVVTFRVPSAYGMTELDSVRAEVLAVNTALGTNTITVDVDSSSFTTFAFPSSTNFQTSFAQVIPVGEVAQDVDNPSDNQGIVGIEFGSAVCGAEGDEIDFWCFYGGQVL